MTEKIAKTNLLSLLPKDSIEGKDFLNHIYYDNDGHMVASNNFILCAIKIKYDDKKRGKCENKEGNVADNVKYPLWQHLFKGKSFNAIDVDYDKLDEIISDCKVKMKKLPKSKYKLTPQPCEMIKFNNTYFRIKNFELFVKMGKLLKINEFRYGGSDDRMIGISKDGKIVINPMIWYNKENLLDEPIDYFNYHIKDDNIINKKETKTLKTKNKNGKK